MRGQSSLEKRIREEGGFEVIKDFSSKIKQFTSRYTGIITGGILSVTMIGTTIGLITLDRRSLPKFVEPDMYRIERHDVDQVFRDHDGYRIYFDNDNGEYIEKKYFDDGEIDYPINSDVPFPVIKESELFRGVKDGDSHIKVYRDLLEGEQGYAQIVRYKKHGRLDLAGHSEPNLYYVEIHLPHNQDISPGTERYGGKHSIHDPMSEIK